MKMHSRALVRTLKNELGDPRRGAEVGVWQGRNSAELLRSFESLYLLMIDPYLPYEGAQKECHTRLSRKTPEEFTEAWRLAIERTHFANGRRMLLVMTSTEAARSQVVNSDLDFVFIDGSHDYDSVREDLDAWEPKIRPGGLICGHDYNGKGDRSGRFGVKRAVDERYGEANVAEAGGLVWWVRKESEDD